MDKIFKSKQYVKNHPVSCERVRFAHSHSTDGWFLSMLGNIPSLQSRLDLRPSIICR